MHNAGNVVIIDIARRTKLNEDSVATLEDEWLALTAQIEAARAEATVA